MVMSTRCRMRLLVAEEDAMSPLRGHKEPAPDDSGVVEDPKKAKAKDAVPVVDPGVVESAPVVEPVEEKFTE